MPSGLDGGGGHGGGGASIIDDATGVGVAAWSDDVVGVCVMLSPAGTVGAVGPPSASSPLLLLGRLPPGCAWFQS